MANPLVYMGLDPVQMKSTPPHTRVVPLMTSGVSPSVPLFRGSAVLITDGYAVEATTGGVTGSVVLIRDANGFPVLNWPVNEGGSVEITDDPDQEFEVQMDDNSFALTDVGQTYDLTAETAVASTTSTDGDGFSKRLLDHTTKHASTGAFKVIGVAPKFINDVSSNYTTLRVVINEYSAGV